VTNGNKILVKSPTTTELFKNKTPDIPFPPSTSITDYTLVNLVGCHVLCTKL
jgi:hypothetical protein